MVWSAGSPESRSTFTRTPDFLAAAARRASCFSAHLRASISIVSKMPGWMNCSGTSGEIGAITCTRINSAPRDFANSIAVLNAPLETVDRSDATDDPLETTHAASHLSGRLARRLILVTRTCGVGWSMTRILPVLAVLNTLRNAPDAPLPRAGFRIGFNTPSVVRGPMERVTATSRQRAWCESMWIIHRSSPSAAGAPYQTGCSGGDCSGPCGTAE